MKPLHETEGSAIESQAALELQQHTIKQRQRQRSRMKQKGPERYLVLALQAFDYRHPLHHRLVRLQR